MTTLAIYSNKGGVGKTAAAVNLAYLAAKGGFTTLLCDLDAQGAATFYFRVKPRLKRGARGLVRGRKQLDRSIKATDYANLDLLPADFSHRNLDITFDRQRHRRRRLEIALTRLQREYDLIVLDCPPTINILAENIFEAADQLLIPLIPTTLSVRSYEQLLNFLDGRGHKGGQVAAFFSMLDRRKKLHMETVETLQERNSNFMRSVIPFLSHVEQMGVFREPVPVFAPHSIAAAAYQALWDEAQERLCLGWAAPDYGGTL